MSKRRIGPWLLALALLGGCAKERPPRRPSPAPAQAELPTRAVPVRVAAASDLSGAFTEIQRTFTLSTGVPVDVTFGSTGMLTTQIRQGAPFDVFAAASASYVDELVAARACDGSTKAPYARGHLVVVTREGVELPASLAELAQPRFEHVAIANPEHAPYGKAAKEALVASGIWDRLEPRIVYGENVRQTLTFVSSGNADAAIVALSLVATTETPRLEVDPALHRPIDQAMILCGERSGAEPVRRFAAFVASDEGRAVLRRYGFLLPDETTTPPP